MSSAKRHDLPKAVHTDELNIGGVALTVHHLDDGRCVIDAKSMADFFHALETGALLMTETDAEALTKWILE